MKTDTVLIDMNELKVHFWNRLATLSVKKRTDDIDSELYAQMYIINELLKMGEQCDYDGQ